MWTTLGLICLGIYVLDLQLRLREVGEQVSRLHQDFLSEVSTRYGEKFDGKK